MVKIRGWESQGIGKKDATWTGRNGSFILNVFPCTSSSKKCFMVEGGWTYKPGFVIRKKTTSFADAKKKAIAYMRAHPSK